MGNIIKSGLYKLLKDWTFRITLIVGVALAIFMNLIYLGVDCLLNDVSEMGFSMCTGQYMAINSLSPTQNFGLTVPINLIVFTVGEFTCGTIRNKIIAGYRKSSIYLSLTIIGLIFTFSLMIIYFGLSVGIASLIGGFNPTGETLIGMNLNGKFIWQYVAMGFAVYVFIVSFAIFIASSIRQIGGSLPLVIIFILMLYFVGFGISIASFSQNEEITNLINILFFVNPLQSYGVFGLGIGVEYVYTSSQFIGAIITPIYWAILFYLLGLLVFIKKDIK